MFSNFAWSEMLVIACVAIIVVGPKDLPGMLRGLGKTIGNVKRMASDFQQQFNDAIKESELDEIADMAKNKTIAPLDDAKNAMEDFAQSIKDPMEPDPQVEVAPPPPEKKPTAKKTAAKKTVAKKAAPKKAGATKTAAAKAAPSKATHAKKTAAKKPASRKTASKAGTTSSKTAKSKT